MGASRWFYQSLGWCRAGLVAGAAVVPVLGKLPTAKVALHAPSALWLTKWSDEWGWAVVPAFVTLAATLGFTRGQIVDPEADETLQDLLNHLHKQMFPLAIDERSRLTLFRFRRIQFKKWPWRPAEGGWLVPVKRSGEMHQDFDARFQVGAELTKNCGVAGKAWCDIADAFVVGLPDVHTGNPLKRDVDRYAQQTCMTPEWVRSMKPKSRSFYGMKIRHKQKKWGVIVIDSTDSTLDQEGISKVFANTHRFLSIHASKV